MQMKKKSDLIIIMIIGLFSAHIYAETPERVVLSNVRGTEFTVSWITQSIESGKIKYGTRIADYSNWKTIPDGRGNQTLDDIHYVTIKNLMPHTNYYYEIVSGNTIDNNNGRYYLVNTGPALIPSGESCQPAGKVYKNKENDLLAYDSIVYVRILGENGSDASALESVPVTPETSGFWFMDLVNFRTRDHTSFYPFECGKSTIEIQAQSGGNAFSIMTIKAVDYLISESPSIDFSKSDSIQFVSTTSDIIRGQPGGKFSLHLDYHTSGNPQFNDFGIRVHYNSNQLQFTDVSNAYTGLYAPLNQAETQNENDNNPSTNFFVTLMWPNTENRLSNVWESIQLGTINFIINDQLVFGDTGKINIVSMDTSNQLVASSVTLKVVPYNLDIDCNGQVDALTDGLLILRYLFGFSSDDKMLKSGTNTSFLNGVVDTEHGRCITEAEIVHNIKQLMPQ
jgi:hypothetical protein